MKRKNSIVLIGFMGCGKTSVGVKLSYRMRMSVVDTDKLIEQQEKRSVSKIFADEGEQYFRVLETKLLEALSERPYKYIYSVGGGTPVKAENRELLKKIGTVIYLRIRPESVCERLKNDNTRPLLQCENPLQRIQHMLEERGPKYEAASDFIIEVDGKDIAQLVNEIVEKLQ